MAPSQKAAPLYRAVEHHHFLTRERWLLFDVNALTVIPSCEADGVILQLVSTAPLSRAELVRRAAQRGVGAKHARARVSALAAARFLLKEGQSTVLAKLGQPSSYATFMVNVSQRCNLTCPYCYVNKGHFDYAEKPIAKMKAATAAEIVDRIFENFPGLASYGYHFYGGEPLMNFKVIAQIVAAAEAKAAATGTHTDYHITTNGTLLTRDIADFMDRHQFTVYFSIDGDEQHHDELRKYVKGGGSFADVERNLQYLRSRPGVHLIGSSVIRKGFALKDALEHLTGHGAQQCKAERVRLHRGEALSLENADHDDYLRDIEGLIDHYVDHLEAGRKPMDFRLSSKILQVYTRTRRNFFCPAGDRMFGISSDGEIYPCALHVGRPQSKLGDIKNGLDPEKRRAFREKFSPENQKDCRTCWTRHLCGGGCSAMVDRFGHEDCQSLRRESEAAIAVFQHFIESDPLRILGLVSPKVVRWANGELDDAEQLSPIEPAAQRMHTDPADMIAAAPETAASGRRLRAMHPIRNDLGRYALIYDLERTFIIEVPRRLQPALAAAIASGGLDGRLAGWLDDNDLRTDAMGPQWGEGAQPALPDVTDVSFDMSGACNMGCRYCFEDAINSRIGPMSDATADAALDFVFAKTAAAKRIALHFGSGEPLMRFDLLQRIVAEANRRTAMLGKSIVYDLTTNAKLVTEEIGAFLRDNPFQIRVSCDGPAHLHDKYRPMKGGRPSSPLVERGLRILTRYVPDRLTVNTVICGGTRLRDVWAWAKQSDIQHYHVIKVGTADPDDLGLRDAELSNFRTDLAAICDDMLADLRAGRTPLDYQPITKVVRRLMIPEPITRFCGVAGSYLGVASDGEVFPCFRHIGVKGYRLGDIRSGIDDTMRQQFLASEAADVDNRPVCQGCWARYLCGGGCYADSVVYGPDKRKPQEDHCPFWRSEIETAIRFYDRLRQEDAAYCFALFGDDVDDIIGDGKPARFLQRKNCQ